VKPIVYGQGPSNDTTTSRIRIFQTQNNELVALNINNKNVMIGAEMV